MPPGPVVRVQPNYKDTYEMEVAPTVSPKLDKIVMMSHNHNNYMIALIYINRHYSYINAHVLKKLRRGKY